MGQRGALRALNNSDTHYLFLILFTSGLSAVSNSNLVSALLIDSSTCLSFLARRSFSSSSSPASLRVIHGVEGSDFSRLNSSGERAGEAGVEVALGRKGKAAIPMAVRIKVFRHGALNQAVGQWILVVKRAWSLTLVGLGVVGPGRVVVVVSALSWGSRGESSGSGDRSGAGDSGGLSEEGLAERHEGGDWVEV
jgi:hypothetical protein